MKKRIILLVSTLLLIIIGICIYAYFSTNYGYLIVTTNTLSTKIDIDGKIYNTDDGNFNIRLYSKKYNINITSEDRETISDQVLIKRGQNTRKEYELNLPENYLQDNF